MYAKLRAHILPQLIPTASRVLVAVSGGPDSVALTHVLWRYSQEEDVEISLVLSHVHHGIRAESDQEARLVENMANELGVPCHVHHFKAKEYSKNAGLSFQEGARVWRYARFREDAEREGCTHIATAHHLDDQAETILYRLLRGSGTTGLAGINPDKDGIIRPFLTVTKEEILDYCRQQGLVYALDRSNLEPIYMRNRIRLELLPELKRKYNPRLSEALARTGELMRWDEEYIKQQVEAAWAKYCLHSESTEVVLNREIFHEPKAILSRLLRKAASHISDDPRGLGYIYIAKIMQGKGVLGWTQNLPGLQIQITEQGVVFSKPEGVRRKPRAYDPKHIAVVLETGEWKDIPDLGVRVGLFLTGSKQGFMENAGDERRILLAPQLLTEGELVCRTRQDGDKMWLAGIGHKSLKKIFQESKIAAELRGKWPIIASDREVIWIPGLRRSDKYRGTQSGAGLICVVEPLVQDGEIS